MAARGATELGLGAQFAFFALIGVLTNGALYGLYLWLTFMGIAPFEAMSVSYLAGVALSFASNSRITFAGRSSDGQAFIRFGAAYALGYVFNAAGLYLSVAGMGVPHYWAQLFMICANAALLFVLQRWWVFKALPVNPTSPNNPT